MSTRIVVTESAGVIVKVLNTGPQGPLGTTTDAPYIGFDTTAAHTVLQGQMAWNADEETYDFGLNGAVGQGFLELMYHAQNTSGSTLSDGSPVMYTGSIGGGPNARGTIALMDGTDTANTRNFLGLLTEDIDNNDRGKVTRFGRVRNIDASGATFSFGGSETWSDGEELWVDPDNVGYLTNVEPVAGKVKIRVGLIISAHATQGIIFCQATNLDTNQFTPYTIVAPTADPAWTTVKAALDDISTRLAALEP